MNEVPCPFLCRFILVSFFDNILIFTNTWANHLCHVRAILTVLRQTSSSKCDFGAPSISCLGHVISVDVVAMDARKVQAVLNWPVRALRGFLGLAGYYRKFIQDYGTATALLMALLCKDDFGWSD